MVFASPGHVYGFFNIMYPFILLILIASWDGSFWSLSRSSVHIQTLILSIPRYGFLPLLLNKSFVYV